MSEFKKTGDRNLLYLEAAGGVIREYTGMAAFAPQPVAKYLEAKQVGTGGDISYLFPLRVIFIGETLFLLRSCKGFQELCRRLKQQRDLRSAFYEARAAKRFFDAGYAIVFPESNKSRTRGNDFDFTVIKDGTLVNVEATALNENKEETILNALNKKRGQLSKDAPSVIFCLLPNPLDTQG
jgi:hypothetical protein